MRKIHGPVQHYAWGDTEFIPGLLGAPVDGRPWAELWLGTHPNGPARFDDGRWLSETTGELPYLLKVLAAAQPLSLQTHPDAAQAIDGFARGVYPDDQPKPELLYALTPFEALCGVRPVDATLALLAELGCGNSPLARLLEIDGPGAALCGIYRGALDTRPLVHACATSARPEARWVSRLDERYPGEPSVAATLLLNLVVLAPGQALRLDAGNLHAYLHGAGIELMNASDNVIRGGLTTKPVDVDELLRVADPTPLARPVLPDGDRFELPAADVALVRLGPGDEHVSVGHELTVDLAGGTWYVAPGETLVPEVTTFVVTSL